MSKTEAIRDDAMNFVGHQQILLQRLDFSWRTVFLQCSPIVVRFDQDSSMVRDDKSLRCHFERSEKSFLMS
jgi:hypothetical protein